MVTCMVFNILITVEVVKPVETHLHHIAYAKSLRTKKNGLVTAYACGFARLRAPAKHWRNAFTAEVGTALLSKSLHPQKTIPLQYLLNSQILRLARCPFLVASAKVKTSIFWVPPKAAQDLTPLPSRRPRPLMDLMDLMDLIQKIDGTICECKEGSKKDRNVIPYIIYIY